ncbi:S8 family serine peptidase [Kitasatospora cineracea]|uniref:S8 family serine peptidase n=1 Tax=Kitasatospora cineracea TaxID=88074 RepID=UPI0033F575F1
MAVGAVDKNRKVWPQSNSGPQLMLTAPGVDVVMAGTGGPGSCTSQYCMADGTSDSTAYVSAAAALVFAKYPDLTPGQVANRLVKTAAAPAGVSQLPDSRYGYGVIRPYEALTADIPTGSAQGPLAAADDDTAATDSTGRAPADHRSPSAVQGIQQPSSGLSLPLIAGIGGGAAALLIVVIVVAAVASSRKRRRAQPLPSYQPGPCTAPPGWPPAPQQHVQQPYGPPPGYPQQQAPYQGGGR